MFADTFNRVYERENLDAALRVLVEGGYRVHLPKPADWRDRYAADGRFFRPDWSIMPAADSPAGRDLRAIRRARGSHRRPGAELSADAARRAAVAAIR